MLPGPTVFGSLGKSPGERRVFLTSIFFFRYEAGVAAEKEGGATAEVPMDKRLLELVERMVESSLAKRAYQVYRYVYLHTSIYVYIYRSRSIYLFLSLSINQSIYVYVCIYIYTYIYIYIYIYT